MILAKLYVKAFGPFSNRMLDFETSAGGFHLIYGPNEAGKSSLLRSISGLLFGIPERTSDTFLHQPNALRIGAVLVRSNGRRFSFMRRKGRSKTLLQWDECRPDNTSTEHLDEDHLREFIGSLDINVFQSTFGLDHERLVIGGKDILGGKGDVGQSLFEAGTGLLGLKDFLSTLETEAGQLFSPRATNPVVNKAVSEYQQIKKRARESVLKSSEWARITDELEQVKKRLCETTQKLQTKRRDKDRLSRIHGNLPEIARRKESLQKIDDLSHIPFLPEDARDKRLAAQSEFREAETTWRLAQSKTEELRAKLATLKIHEGILVNGDQIESLYQRVEAYREVVRESPILIANREAVEKQVETKVRDLQSTLKQEEVERLSLPKPTVMRIRDLITTHTTLTSRIEGLREQLSEKQRDLDDTGEELARFAEAKDCSRLEAAIATVTSEGTLQHQLVEAKGSYEDAQKWIDNQVSVLWNGEPVDFRRLSAPGKATLMRFEQEEARLTEEDHRLEDYTARLRKDLQDIRNQMLELASSGELPDPEQLQQIRQRREDGWQSIRQAYIDQTADPEGLAKAFDPHMALPEAYERCVADADRVADELYEESSRVAQHRALQRRENQVTEALQETDRKGQVLNQQWKQHQEAWRSLLATLRLQDMTLKEFDEWMQAREQVLRDYEVADQLAKNIKRLEVLMRESRELLNAALEETGLDQAKKSESLSAFLSRCRQQLEKLRTQNEQRKTKESHLSSVLQEHRAIARRLAEADQELEAWRSRWGEALGPLGLTEKALPVEVEARLDLLDDLRTTVDERNRIQREIEQKDAVRTAFATDVKKMGQTIAGDLVDTDPDEAVEILYRRYKQASSNAQTRDALWERLNEEHERTELAWNKMETCKSKLSQLCVDAQCMSVEELPAIEDGAMEKRTLKTEVQKLEAQLVERNGDSLNAIIQEAEAEDRDSLDARITALQGELKELEESQISLVADKTRLEGELKPMDGGAQAAEASQEGQEVLARIRAAAEEYAQAKLSAVLLRRAIDVYREHNQAPILKRASRIFAELTRGAFERLDTDFDTNDKLVLVGVRQTGERVLVDGMSDGTADQLYLSLRLAAIETYVEGNEPIPLIADDILIQFDDQRAAATLNVLQSLSTKTQVLLFTHHDHIRDLVRDQLDASAVRIHELSPST